MSNHIWESSPVKKALTGLYNPPDSEELRVQVRNLIDKVREDMETEIDIIEDKLKNAGVELDYCPHSDLLETIAMQQLLASRISQLHEAGLLDTEDKNNRLYHWMRRAKRLAGRIADLRNKAVNESRKD